MTDTCLLCGENIELLDRVAPDKMYFEGIPHSTHQECSLRMVLGGIGHLIDHARWCKIEGDPDGGMTYRASAIAVQAWVDEYGIRAAVEVSSD